MKEFTKKMAVPVEGYYGGFVRLRFPDFLRLSEAPNFRIGLLQGTFPPSDGPGICICTFERGASVVNFFVEACRLDEVGVVVIDEAHMIGSGDRGYLLEVLLAKLLYLAPHVQILGPFCGLDLESVP